MLIDTHCHIYDNDYSLDIDEVIERAHAADVMEIICIGSNKQDSLQAVEFAKNHGGVYATVGIHPHEALDSAESTGHFIESILLENGFAAGLRDNNGRSVGPVCSQNGFAPGSTGAPAPGRAWAAGVLPNKGTQRSSQVSCQKIVAIGEIGLDYFHNLTPHENQIQVFEAQIEVALEYDLPIVFHVRDAYEDFWPILDKYKGIRGVLHSFSDNMQNYKEAIKRGLYISVNGLSTFTKIEEQKEIFASIPLDKLLLETDAPYLTPVPFRGKVNEPAFVGNIAEFHANIRQISVKEIADATTANAHDLFGI